MHKSILIGATIGALIASTAQASPTVDGNYDASYGATTASVLYNAAAPTSNFGAPTNENHLSAYNIYLQSDAGFVYGLLRADGATDISAVRFSNLYFDVDPANGNGSDIGFEITNQRMFAAGYAGYYNTPDLAYALSADGLGIEFKIAMGYFMGAQPGLTYDVGQVFAGLGDKVTLRLSQSYGYSVAGGASYGPDRLGSLILKGAVPEPSTWAMMLLGFGALGVTLRSKRRTAVSTAA